MSWFAVDFHSHGYVDGSGLNSFSRGLNANLPRFDTATRAAAVGGVTTLVYNISLSLIFIGGHQSINFISVIRLSPLGGHASQLSASYHPT